jgi:hypothetical protein
LSLVVKGVLTDKGNWDLNFHNDNLPFNIVNHLVVLHAPRDMGRILLNEKNTNARHFTVQSTYDLQRENVHYIDDNWTMVGIGKNHTKFKLLCGWQLWSPSDQLLWEYMESGDFVHLSHMWKWKWNSHPYSILWEIAYIELKYGSC